MNNITLRIKKIERKKEYRIERIVSNDMMKTEIYVGEKSWRWNPQLKGYLRVKTNDIHVFKMEKQAEKLRQALYIMRELIYYRAKIFIVENNEFNGKAVGKLLRKTKQPYITKKYEAGGISRRREIIRQIRTLSRSKTGVIKKRVFQQILKMNDIKTKPGLTVIYNAEQGKGLINENLRYGVRTVGCGSSSLNLPNLTYKILGNYEKKTNRKLFTLQILHTIYDAIRRDARIFKEFNLKLKRGITKLKNKKAKIRY